MREPRNPFRMRASEQIESDATFLSLFSPGVMDVLPRENLWNQVQIFRSAAGGGKTSLFRLFAPSSLLTLYKSHANEDYAGLYSKMKDVGAVTENGPQILGVTLSCARNYSTLEDLDIDPGKKERLLCSLINSRLILATLRNALILKGLNYPNDLNQLYIAAPINIDLPALLPIPCSGQKLYDWACFVEQRVCELIDSFGPLPFESLEGHDTLHSVFIIKPEYILCDNEPIANHTLVMLDDVHKLTASQRQKILTTLFDIRPQIGFWIAERLEALTPEELMTTGATAGREYGVINLEDFWRSSANKRRFEDAFTDIADRRAKSAREVQIGSFAGCLQASLDEPKWQNGFKSAIEGISLRIRKRVAGSKRYDEWIKTKEEHVGTPRERAIGWKALEILIERDIKKSQTTFDFELPTENLEKQEDSSALFSAAEYFISQECKMPYYYSISRLATLSSSNIEQFLSFAGDLFEEIISAALLKQSIILTPERQETILRRAIQQRWNEIPRKVPFGRDVLTLLDAFRECAQWETNKPSAPYAPGVTGIALAMTDRNKLLNSEVRKKNPKYERLINALSSCLSYNLLEASLDRKQGQKGKTWMILYFNRSLCLHFKLPLQYGGWRPKPLEELCNWLDEGFSPHKRKGEKLL